MRKIRAERPSNPQQNHLGMESNPSIALDVAARPGAGWTMAGDGDGRGKIVIRAVSFFGLG